MPPHLTTYLTTEADGLPPGLVADEDGALPIHLVAEYATSVEIVLPVLRAFRAGAARTNGHGQLPLAHPLHRA